MNDSIVGRYITEVKDALTEMATDSMKFPKADPFEHGVQCGRHQGLEFALEILEDVMRDNYEKDKHI